MPNARLSPQGTQRERSKVCESPTRRLVHETRRNPELFWQMPGSQKWRRFDDIYDRWTAKGYDPNAIWQALGLKLPTFVDGKALIVRGGGDWRLRVCRRLPSPHEFEGDIREKTLELEADGMAMQAYEETYARAYETAERRLAAISQNSKTYKRTRARKHK